MELHANFVYFGMSVSAYGSIRRSSANTILRRDSSIAARSSPELLAIDGGGRVRHPGLSHKGIGDYAQFLHFAPHPDARDAFLMLVFPGRADNVRTAWAASWSRSPRDLGFCFFGFGVGCQVLVVFLQS